MNNNTIRIGTRGSKLALYQANRVKDELKATYPDLHIELVIIKTKGDKILDVALSKIGDKGLFTKDLEISLYDNKIDLAVHSLKDLPTKLPEGLCLGGVLKRGEVRDALVSRYNKKLADLTPNHKIATSSLRRRAQLLMINPDFEIIDIRGNVNTRIEKMDNGHCDAMVMAAAGVQRLGYDHRITEILSPEVMIPAVGQGAIAMEVREDDDHTKSIIDKICNKNTLQAVSAERVFLNMLEGGCQVPLGCYTQVSKEEINITGFISHLDGSQKILETITGKFNEADELAQKLAELFLNKGAAKILSEIRKMNNI